MTTITARLAKWCKVVLAFLAGFGGLFAAAHVFWLRDRKRGSAMADDVIDKTTRRWNEIELNEATVIAIIKAKDQAAKREMQEIKREPDFRTRMERMRELKERVMREAKS